MKHACVVFILFIKITVLFSQDNLEIPGMGVFENFSDAMSTWEGDRCSISISADGIIQTSNSCWSGPQCDYKKGNYQGKVSAESIQKFVLLLRDKDLFLPYVNQTDDLNSEKRSSTDYKLVHTSEGRYTLNPLADKSKLDECIWKLCCEAGIADERFLIVDNIYVRKIQFFYENKPNDYQSNFVVFPDGQCWYSELKGNLQIAGAAHNFTNEEIKTIIKSLKTENFKENTLNNFDENIPLEEKKHYKLVYTNVGVFEIKNKKTIEEVLALYQLKRAR